VATSLIKELKIVEKVDQWVGLFYFIDFFKQGKVLRNFATTIGVVFGFDSGSGSQVSACRGLE
jgi:hypothetical protein